MGDRGVRAPLVLVETEEGQLAKVYDMGALSRARARRGGGVGRGQLRRVSPRLRAPRPVVVEDWGKYAELSRREKLDVDRGTRPPLVRVKRLRRAGRVLVKRPFPLSRAQRRLAWKVERRDAGLPKVDWAGSRSARGELAPVVTLGHRGPLRRLSVRPVGVGCAGNDLMDGAA